MHRSTLAVKAIVTLTLTLSAVFASACGGAADAPSEPIADDTEALTTWQKVLSCDGGDVVVDVDTGARTQLQVVIRNRAIIQHLAQNTSDQFNTGSSWRLLRGRAPAATPSAADKMILGVFSRGGVFSPGDFRSGSSSPSPGYSVDVRRDGGGLFVQLQTEGGWRCSEGGHFSTEDCAASGNVWYRENGTDLGNWYFRSCR